MTSFKDSFIIKGTVQHWVDPDTCDCEFEVNQDGTFKQSVNHCKLHTMPDGIGHYNAALTHNQGFNTRPNRTDEQRQDDRAAEKARIARL